MSSAIASFFSSILSTTHSDSEETNNKVEESAPADEQTTAEEPAAEEEAEEEEPEDLQPVLREECKQTPKCAPLLKHFEHCQEKVTAGHGFKGEDCVEELYVPTFFLRSFFHTDATILPEQMYVPPVNYLNGNLIFDFTFLSLLIALFAVHLMHCADECAAPKLFSKLR